jgi:hypothetical protein
MSDMKFHLDCECGSPEHITRYSLWDWGSNFAPEMMLELQASPCLSWYERIGVAFKYIFTGNGIKWHDVIIDPKDADKLLNMVTEYKKLIDQFEKDKPNV